MTITIKYSLEGTEKAYNTYNTFEEIQQFEDYNDILYINCGDNNLVELPPNLPQSLIELYCDSNNLTELPEDLPQSLQKLLCFNNKLITIGSKIPASLQELDCGNNRLTKLPTNLPQSLQTLYCNNNKLVALPPNLPQSLQVLWCSDNNLVELPPNWPQSLLEIWCTNNTLVALPPNLPQYLQVLWCSYNNIVELPPNLPQSLQTLDCHNNKLVALPPNLPQSLQVLNCYHNNLRALPPNLTQSLLELRCGHNKLVALPTNLHEYRDLTRVDYSGNEIEYIPPHITRFLNRLRGRRGKTDKIYDDGQNVHNHQIQESIRNSIYAVMKTKPSITTDEMISELVSSVILTEKTKRLLMEYCGQEPQCIHSVICITFKELLRAIWSIIRDHKDRDEILAIMNTEMDDADCKCFTGQLSRLINCLNGYDSRVSITMADNDQISNIIIIEKEKLETEDLYTTESHRDNVRIAMEERGYALEVIEEWSSYIE